MVLEQRSDERRARLRMWAAVAPAWSAHADYADARAAPITQAMLGLTAPEPGERVLELACGPGGAGLAAARRVGARGEVVLSDVVPEMISIAAARAATLGLHNVRTLVLDLEHIDQPDAAFDIVLCREGLMFATDPARAVLEIRRVLRPAGRVALAVWGPPARNPWLSVVFDVVSAQLGELVPPPGVPGPFSLADPDRLADLVADAGLIDVAITEVSAPVHAASIEEWWSRTSSLAGLLAARLQRLPDEAAQAVRGRLQGAVRPYMGASGLEFPGVSLIASGRRVPSARASAEVGPVSAAAGPVEVAHEG
jgi:SAM-dependent methyltransferase